MIYANQAYEESLERNFFYINSPTVGIDGSNRMVMTVLLIDVGDVLEWRMIIRTDESFSENFVKPYNQEASQLMNVFQGLAYEDELFPVHGT
ncbi:hypothetical protein C5167_004757 [Papaver somniferum]|uniref:Uncharacterized protein n=1 Tax=Papaver somniferum TaxID=3469 RepID=A0A4Y7JBR0_PAPSO|nr:hypothetical protein C5167_004757 [Papaver somniferum]